MLGWVTAQLPLNLKQCSGAMQPSGARQHRTERHMRARSLQASSEEARLGTHMRRAGEGENFEAVVGGEHVGAVALARQDGERACGSKSRGDLQALEDSLNPNPIREWEWITSCKGPKSNQSSKIRGNCAICLGLPANCQVLKGMP